MLPRVLYLSYHVCGAYITILFIQKLLGVFQQLFFLGQSYHGVLYISKSSCLWCINHHVNVQKELQRYVIKNFSPREKVIIVFLRNLSKIIMLLTHKLLAALSFLFEQKLLYISHCVHGEYITE